MACETLHRETVSQGDKFRLRFPVKDLVTGLPKVYTSPVASFAMSAGAYPVKGETPVLEKSSGSGVSIAQETIDAVLYWVVSVDFEQVDTLDNPDVEEGTHYCEVLVVDSGTQPFTVATLQLVIKPTIIR
jgi:hypothetical protein